MLYCWSFIYNLVHQGCEVQGWKGCSCVVLQQQFFMAAFKEVLKSTSGVDLGSEWLNYAMIFLVETKTRDTCFGAGVQNYAKTSCL
jgi:hypothetical protein